jgi:hypothetical protein
MFAMASIALAKYPMSQHVLKLIMQNSCNLLIKRCNAKKFADWLSLKKQPTFPAIFHFPGEKW